MSAYVRAELFFSGQHARSGLRMIDNSTVPAPGADDVPLLAMRGALSMRAAVLAAHAGMPNEAADRIIGQRPQKCRGKALARECHCDIAR